MTASNTPRITRTETSRWVRDPVVLITIGALIIVSAALTYLAISVATGSTSSGGNGVQLQTDTTLTGESTNDDLASMARSSLTMLVPIAAIIVGVRFAGGELTSGALLQMGVAARRLRFLFLVRLVLLAVIVGIAGAATSAVTLAATEAARAQSADLTHLTVWEAGGSPVLGAAMQAVVIAVLAFGLSALTRRWIVITICMLVYIVGLEPALSGLFADASAWLPRTATSELMVPQPDLAHVLPTAICALLLAVIAVASLRRDRVSR